MFLELAELLLSPVPLFLTLSAAALATAHVTWRAVPLAGGAFLVIKQRF